MSRCGSAVRTGIMAACPPRTPSTTSSSSSPTPRPRWRGTPASPAWPGCGSTSGDAARPSSHRCRVDEGTIIDLVPGLDDPGPRGHLDHICLVVSRPDLDTLAADPGLEVVDRGPGSAPGARPSRSTSATPTACSSSSAPTSRDTSVTGRPSPETNDTPNALFIKRDPGHHCPRASRTGAGSRRGHGPHLPRRRAGGARARSRLGPPHGRRRGRHVGRVDRRPPCCGAACPPSTCPRSPWAASPLTPRRHHAGPCRDRPSSRRCALGSFVGRPPRLPTIALIGAWLRRPWRVDPFTAIASVIPDGTLDLVEHASAIDEIAGVTVARRRHLDLRGPPARRTPHRPRARRRRTAGLGRGGVVRHPRLLPSRRHRRRHLRRRRRALPDQRRRARGGPELDLAIVVSPMSGRDLGRLGARNLVRRHARRQARRRAPASRGGRGPDSS